MKNSRKSKSEATKSGRIGVWLLGAYGGLATTLVAGARMIARGLSGTTGLLTATDALRTLDFPAVSDMVFGGHDIRRASYLESATEIYAQNRTLDLQKLEVIREDLAAIDADIRPGCSLNCGPAVRGLKAKNGFRAASPAAAIERIAADLKDFQARHRLETVVVVNVASTEPPSVEPKEASDSDAFRRYLKTAAAKRLRASTLYGVAAAECGFPFINFTPNASSLWPAVQAMAVEHGAPVAGNDGKTGETLVKSALAPMFKYRNLQVLTWQGYNILGDRDGLVLSNPKHKSAKVKSKDGVLSRILGYPLHTHVGIDYVPSLGDQKTAWDFIHFQGFLDYKMSLQFTWQGCDAILAAPVVLDLIRFAELARRRGESGLMTQVSCFFKSPVGVDEHDLHFQFHHLLDYARRVQAKKAWPTGRIARPGEILFGAHRP